MSSWNNGRLHFRERKMPSSFSQTNIKNCNSAVCAIALNEELYIDEWIDYHLALGFEQICIYDNSKDNSLKSKNRDKVTIIHFPGTTKQLEAYNHFIRTNKTRCKWGAFIDIDEFIILKKHNNINDFLNNYDDNDCIGLNWKMFGTSNNTTYINEPVTKRFQMCSEQINKHIKCISKLNKIENFYNPHFPSLINGIIKDTNNNTISGPYNNDGSDNIACIHHYYTKSEEEFKAKLERGRSDIIWKKNLDELIDIHSKNNDIYNSDAWDFYSKHYVPS